MEKKGKGDEKEGDGASLDQDNLFPIGTSTEEETLSDDNDAKMSKNARDDEEEEETKSEEI